MNHFSARTLIACVGLGFCVIFVGACDRLEFAGFGAKQAASTTPIEEEPKTAQITVWGGRYEVFLEHRLLMVNTPARFITHITDLETAEPRRQGTVTFVLNHSTAQAITHMEPAPARDGIYLPTFTFPQPGEWQVTLRIPTADREVSVPLPPMTVFASAAEVARAPDPVEPEGISFLKEQQWKLQTRTAPVRRQRVVEHVRVPGLVTARPGSRATVVPPVAGHFLPPPEASLPELGSQVQLGQVLATVQPQLVGADLLTFLSAQQQIHALEVELAVKTATAEAEALRARATRNHAEQALQRVRTLRRQQAKSARELEEAEYAFRKATADLEAAQALVSTYRTAKKQLANRPNAIDPRSGMPAVLLTAPIAGRLIAVEATVGEHVGPDEAVFTILNTERVFLQAQIPEADLSQLRATHGARYETAAEPGTLVPILEQDGGRLVTFGNTVDAATRTVPLVYEVPNPDGRLRIGMALHIYVETAHAEEALVVPVSALIEEDGQPVAFVQMAGETFARRHLTLGIRDGSSVQVLDGLAEGEQVVTHGAYAVRLASVSATIPAHGHAH